MKLRKPDLPRFFIPLPALAGTGMAFFLCSLSYEPISLITLCTGLAINSITICYTISYLLFLDRPDETLSKDASKEARITGMPAILTTVIVSLILLFSGIPVLEQIGLFSAISVTASWVFVHAFLPPIFTATRTGESIRLPFKYIISRLPRTGIKGTIAACAFGLMMFYYSWPELNLSSLCFKVLTLVGAAIAVTMFLFFLNWKLTFVSIIPVLFVLITCLFIVNLLELSTDYSSLALPVVLMVMSAGYSIYFVRSWQRYGDWAHPSFESVRTSAFLSCLFGVIVLGASGFMEHQVLKSAGLVGVLAIGVILIGNYVILPPVLEYLFRKGKHDTGRYPTKPHARVLRRYRNMEPYPRLFARFKLRLDPMFSELGGLFQSWSGVNTILDIGTGYGVPAAWFLERFKDARIYGIEPDGERVRVASAAVGNRGHIVQGMAPEIPKAPEPADAALMLDMMHYLSDAQLELALKGIRSSLRNNGRLVIKVAVPYQRTPSCLWRFENFRLRLFRIPVYYRSPETIRKAITMAGFEIEIAAHSQFNTELFWLVAKPVHETRKSR